MSKSRILCLIVFFVLTIISGFLIPLVKINYDSSKYLPNDSKTIEAVNILEEEFGNNGSLLIMIEDFKDRDEILNNLMGNEVVNITYKEKDGNILFSVIFKNNDYDSLTQEALKKTIDYLKENNYTYYLSGQSYLTYVYNQSILKEMPRIILILMPIILLILILMTSSFIEPFLFILVVAISVILNLGTNSFLPNVSYMTYSIGSVLQFALCMDYSIMLLERYKHEKKIVNDKHIAMKRAFKSAFVPIISSSLTTIAGFIAMMFMKYKIGLDIGLVLAKGVFFTVVTVIFLMPTLIIISDKLIEKTKHKNILEIIKPKNSKNKVTGFIYNKRFIIIILAVIISVFAFILQRNNNFKYSDNASTDGIKEVELSKIKIKETFGLNNQIVILLPKDLDTSNIVEEIKSINSESLKNIISYDSKLEKSDLKNDFGLDDNLFSLLDEIFKTDKISVKDLLTLLSKLELINNKMEEEELEEYLLYTFGISEDLSFIYQMLNTQKISLSELISTLVTPISKEEMKNVFNSALKDSEINQIYGSSSLMSPSELLNRYSIYLDMKLNISSAYTLLEHSISMDFLNIIYTGKGKTSLSVKEITNGILDNYEASNMKIIIPGFDNMIDATYLALNASKLDLFKVLNSLKNYSSLTIEEQEKIEVMLQTIIVYKSKEVLFLGLENIKPTLTLFNSLDPGILNQLSLVDAKEIKSNFVGENYQRIIITQNMIEEDDLTFKYLDDVKKVFDDKNIESYFISTSNAIKEIKEISNLDYEITQLISIILIFIIVLLSFKSFVIPIILIIIIESAIFVNMAIPSIAGEPLIFIGYVIVGCIELGATIDYGILVANRYLSQASDLNRKEKMQNAISESLNSILTSGCILTIVGFFLAIGFNIPAISSMGRLIGFGGLISSIFVIFVLPGMLVIADKMKIIKTKKPF